MRKRVAYPIFFRLAFLLACAPAGGFADNSNDPGTGPVTVKFDDTKMQQAQMPSQSDRGQKSKAASAAAAAAGAQQQIGCMQMMQAAQDEEDKTTKFIMLQMAQQQCQQAQASQDAASKNDDSSKQLSQADIPTMGSITAGKYTISEDSNAKDPNLLSQLAKKPAAPASDDSIPDVAPFQPSLPSASGAVSPDSDPGVAPFKGKAVEPTSALAPVPPQKLSYDDSNKGGDPLNSQSQSSYPMGFNFGGAKTLADEENKKDKDKTGTDPKGAAVGSRRGRGTSDDGPAPSGYSGGGESSESKGDSLETMLSQLMGGGAAGAELPPPGEDIVVLRSTASKGDGKEPNLFEFAGYLYQKAANEEGKLRRRPPKNPKLIDSAMTAHASVSR